MAMIKLELSCAAIRQHSAVHFVIGLPALARTKRLLWFYSDVSFFQYISN